MENITPEMIEKAKTAKSPEELLAMANQAGLGLEQEDAERYFEMLNPKMGELSDDELDNVSGGGCKSKKSGRTIVTNHCKCFNGMWESNVKGYNPNYSPGLSADRYVYHKYSNPLLRDTWASCCGPHKCGSCRWLEFEGGTGVCEKS